MTDVTDLTDLTDLTDVTGGRDRLDPSPARMSFDLPGPLAENTILRESYWYDYSLGIDRPVMPSWIHEVPAPMDDHVPPPAVVGSGAVHPLPDRTMDALGGLAFPHGRLGASGSPGDAAPGAVARALVTAFGIQWFDPDNPYKVHRSYASPRCLYPVQVFVATAAGAWHQFDPERHRFVGVTDEVDPASSGTTGADPTDIRRILLTGRYTRIPPAYKWLRSSLVNSEIGIMLRSLAIALELHGVPAAVVLPHADGLAELRAVGLPDPGEWSLPVVVEVGDAATTSATRPLAPPPTPTTRPSPETLRVPATVDRSLEHLVAANRTQSRPARAVALGTGIPDGLPATGQDWAETIWQRNSGRMPRELHGISCRPGVLPGDVLERLVAWLEVPPPGDLLREVFALFSVDLAVRDVAGVADGAHRLVDGRLVLRERSSDLLARLETRYGYPQSPEAGCDIHNAAAVAMLWVRPRAAVEAHGPSAWAAIQHVAGWLTHGMCLSAGAEGLFLRPTRAFMEGATQEVMGRDTDETLALAFVLGRPRHAATRLVDLRI